MSGKRARSPNPLDAGHDERRVRGRREGSSSPANINRSFNSATSQETEPDTMPAAAASFLEPERRSSRALDMNTILNPTNTSASPTLSRRRSAAHLEEPEEGPSPKRPAYSPVSAQERAATLPRAAGRRTGAQFFEAKKIPFPVADDTKPPPPGMTMSPLRSPTRTASAGFPPTSLPGVSSESSRQVVSESPTAGAAHPVSLPAFPRNQSALSSLNASPISSTSSIMPAIHPHPFPDTMGLEHHHYPPGYYAGFYPQGAVAVGAAYGFEGAPHIQLLVDSSGAGSKEMNNRRAKNSEASKRFRFKKKAQIEELQTSARQMRHRIRILEERLQRRDEDIEKFRMLVPESEWPRRRGDTPEPTSTPPDTPPQEPAPGTRRRRAASTSSRRGGRRALSASSTPIEGPSTGLIPASEAFFPTAAAAFGPPIDRSRQSSVSEGARTPIVGPQGEGRQARGGSYGFERDHRDPREPFGFGAQHGEDHRGRAGLAGPGSMMRGALGEGYPMGTQAEAHRGLGAGPSPRPTEYGEFPAGPGGGVSLQPFTQHGFSRPPQEPPALGRSDTLPPPPLDTRRILPPLPPSSGAPFPPHSGPSRPL